jgi:hypothetical protein
MRGTVTDLEVEIYATKLANETSPWKPIYGIKGRTSENSTYRLRNQWSKTMKLANETSPWTPMHGIKGRTSENSAYRLRNLWSKTMKLANETSPWAPMYGIKGGLVKIVPTACAICGVNPWN